METNKKIALITGSKGFIGKNLLAGLHRMKHIAVRTFDRGDSIDNLQEALKTVDIIYHLAGENRPKDEKDFHEVNAGLTQKIINILDTHQKKPIVVLASSTQVELANAYGASKKAAEKALIAFSKKTGAEICIYRLPGVFGKWSRPNYNTVVATFCHNIARGLDITISDPEKKIELVYIDDVVRRFLLHLEENKKSKNPYRKIERSFTVTLGELADKIISLRDMRKTLKVPDLSDEFLKCLHATYSSFLDKNQFAYPLEVKTDNRGTLFELIKSDHFGQIFISKTHKGIIRGNHFHDSKTEKFCVIQGKAVIRFRSILDKEVIEYNVSDKKIEVVDIPPGYTHHIENLSDGEMIVLFWANQVFDPEHPDTYICEVL